MFNDIKFNLQEFTWMADFNGDDTGYNSVEVVGCYMHNNSGRLFYIDMDKLKIIEELPTSNTKGKLTITVDNVVKLEKTDTLYNCYVIAIDTLLEQVDCYTEWNSLNTKNFKVDNEDWYVDFTTVPINIFKDTVDFTLRELSEIIAE